jgi:hypothetical protein
MILDFEEELSTLAGQLFNAADGNAEYGSLAFDLWGGKTSIAAGRDLAVGEPVMAVFRVITADNDVGTSYDLQIVNDTDGAGGSEVVMATKTVLAAALTQNSLHYVGPITPGQCALRYLTAKVITHGSTPTTGPLKVWLVKGADVADVNLANP